MTEIRCEICRATVVLCKPPPAAVEKDGYWHVELDGLVGVGSTPEKAAADFAVDVHAAWQHLADSDDATLTQDAIELRKRVLELVKEVRQDP